MDERERKENMKECNLKENLAACNCTYEPCSRKGFCCECVRYHRQKGALPACYFPADAEKKYDRSIEHFIRIRKEKGE